jgi:hypothetical protein
MKNELFPFQVSEPKDMTVLEQVLCAVYLATHKTLKELRQGQSLIEQQFKMARENRCPQKTFDNLGAMQDNYAAAVAYQTFGEDSCWMAFINPLPE